MAAALPLCSAGNVAKGKGPSWIGIGAGRPLPCFSEKFCCCPCRPTPIGLPRGHPCHVCEVPLLVLLQAQARLQVLERQPRPAEVAVIGAGYAGVELATTVQERLGRRGQVKLITAGGYMGLLHSGCSVAHPMCCSGLTY